MNIAAPIAAATAVNRLAKGSPMPATLGRVADEYYEIREIRLAMKAETDAVEEREKELRAYLIDNLSKSAAAGGDSGAAGMHHRAQVTTKTVYSAVDWPSFHKWVAANDRFDMLQKRLSDKAVTDWIEQNKLLLPGLQVVYVPEVSITKL
jgi:hypothetical protein